MKTFIFTMRVPVTITVDAESELAASEKLLTLRRYSMTSPDGERIDMRAEDIQSVERADDDLWQDADEIV